MRFTFKKGLIATSLALAFGSFGSAHAADIIQFDPDGTGNATNGTFSVGAFDWAVNSALADQVFPLTFANSDPVNNPSQPFDLYFHAALQGFQDLNGNPSGAPTGLNTAFEITVAGGFQERVQAGTVNISGPVLINDGGDGVGGGNDVYQVVRSIGLEFVGGGTNFIRMYYDDFSGGVQSDALGGTGYDDGHLILTAELTGATGTFSSTETFTDLNNNGMADVGEVTLLLDNFSVDNWGGQNSVSGDGSTSLAADVTFFDNTFFLTALSQVLQDLDFTTETNLPFRQTNPSQSFDTQAGGTITLAGGGIVLGDVNGGTNQGDDLLLQADASNSFTAARVVPEPGILGLLGLGLMGLALSRRTARK